MNKRTLALCLIICMLFTNFESFTNISFAAVSESEYPGYSTLSAPEKAAIDTLKAVNVPLKNLKGMYICVRVYVKYSQVAYDVKGKYLTSLGYGDQDYDSKEWRYLGYSYSGVEITNDAKYNDAGKTNVASLPSKNWTRVDPNTQTWTAVDLDAEEALLGTPFISEDGVGEPNSLNYNISNVLLAKVGYLYSRNGLSASQKKVMKSYAQVLVVPSIANDGSVKLVQRKGTSNRYNTLKVNNVSKKFTPSMSITTFSDLACTQPKTKFDIASDKDSVDVYVKVKTDVEFKDALLIGKEALFISSVVNSLSAKNPLPPNGAYKGLPLTNFSTPSQMKDVVKLTYKRSDFANVYKTISLKANAVVTPKTTILNLTKNVSTTGSFQVKALEKFEPIKDDLRPDFSIWYQSVNKTGQAVSHDKPTIDKDFTFALKDQTEVPTLNQIANYKWYIYNELSQNFDYISADKDPLFTLKVADVPRYVKNGTLQFKQVVTDRLGKVYPDVEHSVQILTVGQIDPEPDPDPVPPVTPPVVPTAWVYPPKGVYAGERTFITGEATITGGTITDYDFGLASSFMTINGLLKEKQGTFLSYDTKEDTTLTVTANDGSTDSDQGETNVLHPIRPVMKTNGVYKINRTIELDSTDSFGTEFYPIDKVTWTIKPKDNQDINNIKTHDSSTTVNGAKQVIGAKPKVNFKQLGRYEVIMDVHSTCTYTGETHRTASKQVMGIITIVPDLPPVARLSVPSAVIRDLEAYKMAIFDIQDLSYSVDGDTIARRVYYYRYDTNNDKSLTDEAWIVIDDGNNTQLQFKTPLVGLYEFKIGVEEGNDSFGSPFWTSADILTDNTDSQLLSEKITEVVNVAPITSIFAERKKVDVVFATDYEGAELSQLKSEIDMLTKDLYEQGIDIQVSFINDRIYSGTYKDAIYTFARLARVTYDKVYRDYLNPVDQFYRGVVDTFNWDVRYQSDKDYIPNYGAIPVGTTIRDYDNSTGGMLNRGKYVDMSAPTDPTKKNHTTGLTTEFANGSSGFTATYSNIDSSVDGFFTNLGINSYINRDLFCIDLAKVKASTYRTFADKKLYFLTKNANSLLKLDDSFKQWVKLNDIEVSAVSGGSLKDKLGGNTFKNILLEGDSTYYQAENNDQYKLGGTNGSLPESFLTSIPQGSKGFSGMGLELQGQTPNGWVLTANDCTNPSYWMYVRDASGQVYNYLSEGGNLVKKDGSYNVVRNFGTLYNAIKLADDTGYIYNTASGTFLMLSNYVNSDGRAETYYPPSWEQDSEVNYFNTTTYSYTETQLPASVDGSMVTNLTMRKSKRNSWDDYTYMQTAVIRCSNGSSYYINRKQGEEAFSSFSPIGGSSRYGTTRSGLNTTSTKTLMPLAENYSVLVGINGNQLCGLTNTGLLRTASLRYETDNITGLTWDTGSWMPGAYQKAIIRSNGSSMEGLMLKTDGSVLALGSSNNNRYGYNRYMTWENPIIEARNVTNEAPVSLGELLSLNTKSKVYNTFADLKANLSAEYMNIPYTAQMTVLVDDSLDYQVLYEDYEGDGKYEDAVAITHNPNALENPIGTDPNNGKTVANWNGRFYKTGLYSLNPKVRDNPNEDNRFDDYRLWNKDDMTMNVLVHRKPFPRPRYTQSGHADPSKVYLNAQDSWSYDLDRISSANRGISEVEWGFKAVADEVWQIGTGVLGTTMQKEMVRGTRYMMSYKVKDVDGAWSLPVVEEMTAGANLLFDANMKAKDSNQDLQKFPKGSTVTFTNVWSSYELNHHLEVQLFDGTTAITGKTLIAKNGATVSSENYPEVYWKDVDYTLPNNLSEKTYKARISAVDDASPSIVKYKEFPVTIVSNSAPTITFTKIDPHNLYEADIAKVQVKVTDPDGDRLKVQIYISYDGKPEKMLETHDNVISGTVLDLKTFEIPNAKSIKLRGVAIDPYLAEGQAEMVKPIQSFGIENVKITGAWQHWRGQQNAFGQLMSNEPNRFLSYEKIYIAVESRGNPDQVKLRLEAPLEAMRYTDPKGNDYDYKDELGYEVSFPINFMPVDVNKFNLDYILPFANSTIDWKDKRKKPPYKLYVTLIKDGRTRMMTIGDDAGEPSIDVTGNIFDLVYNQPAKKKR